MTAQAASGSRKSIVITVATLVAVVSALFLGIILKVVQSQPPIEAQLEALNVLVMPTPRSLTPVTLQRHDGSSFSTTDFQGQWNVVNFGYTYCPDICPTNMADMNIAAKTLAAEGLANQVQFWMVTVDPARDTVEQLSQYVPYFNPSFIGLTGEANAINTLATELATVYYQEGEGEGYTVAHSDNYALINPQGHLIALARPPHQPGQLADAMRVLLK